jgi:hypothetical protein
MKKITEIYKEYRIMPMLAIHQMRVAGVAMQICGSLDIEVDTQSVVKACLLHDMGNIIKFKLDKFPEWNEPEGTEYWEKVKYDFILKYGNHEHHASIKIVEEIGVSTRIKDLVNCVDSSSVEIIKMDNDFCKKICIYADNRVNPHNIVSIEERNLEAKKRYENHPNSFGDEEREFFAKNIREIEKQIFSHCKIKPEDINDESIKNYLEKLQDFSI